MQTYLPNQVSFKKRVLTLLAVAIITRLIYTGVGIAVRELLLDPSKPFVSWTYNSAYPFINVWTVWDSGFYYDIATNGYRNNLSKNKTTITIPEKSWVRMWTGSVHLGDVRFTLAPAPEGESNAHSSFLINPTDTPVELPIYNAYAGIPYCIYKGPIDYDRDVVSSRAALDSPMACVSKNCDSYGLTYFDVAEQKVLYQEQFDSVNYNRPLKVLGESRPVGFTDEPFQGLGCKNVKEDEVIYGSIIDYTRDPSPYPFMPLYPYMSGALGQVLGDIVMSGLLISNLSLLISVIFLYKMLRIDFSEKTSFYASLFYLISPVNFILSGFFTESLFSCLLILSIYFAKTNKFFLSLMFATFLAVTRVTGIFVLIPIFYLLYKSQTKLKLLKFLMGIFVVPSLVTLHMLNVTQLTGDLFVLFNAQRAYGRGFEFVKTLIYEIGIGRYHLVFELIYAILVMGLILYAVKFVKAKDENGNTKPMPIEHTITALYLALIPLSTGTVYSFPRFSLTMFAVYIALGYFSEKKKAFWLVSLLLFIASCVLMSLWAISSRYVV